MDKSHLEIVLNIPNPEILTMELDYTSHVFKVDQLLQPLEMNNLRSLRVTINTLLRNAIDLEELITFKKWCEDDSLGKPFTYSNFGQDVEQ